MHKSNCLQQVPLEINLPDPSSLLTSPLLNDNTHTHHSIQDIHDLGPKEVEIIQMPKDQLFDPDFIDSQEHLRSGRQRSSRDDDGCIDDSERGELDKEYEGGGLKDILWWTSHEEQKVTV